MLYNLEAESKPSIQTKEEEVRSTTLKTHITTSKVLQSDLQNFWWQIAGLSLGLMLSCPFLLFMAVIILADYHHQQGGVEMHSQYKRWRCLTHSPLVTEAEFKLSDNTRISDYEIENDKE